MYFMCRFLSALCVRGLIVSMSGLSSNQDSCLVMRAPSKYKRVIASKERRNSYSENIVDRNDI